MLDYDKLLAKANDLYREARDHDKRHPGIASEQVKAIFRVLVDELNKKLFQKTVFDTVRM